MSVIIETTIGDITIDLFTDDRPKTCLNFLKLCKMKYYNFHLLYSVERNFIVQTGDPVATGRGGSSIYQYVVGDQARFYEGEKLPVLKHTNLGTVSMASCGSHMFGSQFFITLGENLDSLDGEHLVFGQVVEGMDVLCKLNQTLTNEDNRPFQDIRISHTVVLNDPYPDPDNVDFPFDSPKPTRDMLESDYIAADEDINDMEGKTMEEIQEEIADREAKARATILEMVGDLPDAELAPPENVLFVCKLNPVTTSEDLEIIFSRFGKINCCEVIRDRVSDNSLQYAFIEFAETKSCEDAYFKMDNVLIDDRRIHVDFSQSVSKIKWRGRGKGVEYFDDSGRKIEARRGQNYDPNKEFGRHNDRNRNSNRGSRGRGGGWGNNFRSANGGPRQQYYNNRDFHKSWENRRGNRNDFNRNSRDNRYDGGRFFQDSRDDRYGGGRRYDDRRDEERNNKNKRRNERDGRFDEMRNERYNDRREGDFRYYDDKDDQQSDSYEYKKYERDDRRYYEDERNPDRRDTQKDRLRDDRNGRSSVDIGEKENRHKRRHSGSDDSEQVPSDEEVRGKLLKHLKKSLKKKKKKHKKQNDTGSDSESEEEEKEKKKKKKKKKKKESSDSEDSSAVEDAKKKSKKSKKKKKKGSSESEDSESDLESKKKNKKSKKKRKKKKKEAATSDSSN